ncbi:MAG: glycoside hydrolase family 16 protein [Winogradskyella sp.]|nr:glycoside hydrolase family 16 protein [Winogradskyella sp.]
MKLYPNKLTSTLILITTLLSCMNTDKKQGVNAPENSRNSIKEINTTIYQPGPGYSLVWADEFDGDTINTNNWNFQVEDAGRFNEEWQRYTDSSKNAYIKDNNLIIKAIHESNKHSKNQYTSARLNTANKQSWTYGKIVARMKLPHGEGIWPAFWMLGTNIDENGGDTPWPKSGEIDIMELFGFRNDSVVEGNLHYENTAGKYTMMGAEEFKLDTGKFADNFHIFELEWTADSITWLVDGQKFASQSILAEDFEAFHKDFFIILNIAVGGSFAGRPNATTNFPQYMHIDWIRVYQQNTE